MGENRKDHDLTITVTELNIQSVHFSIGICHGLSHSKRNPTQKKPRSPTWKSLRTPEGLPLFVTSYTSLSLLGFIAVLNRPERDIHRVFHDSTLHGESLPHNSNHVPRTARQTVLVWLHRSNVTSRTSADFIPVLSWLMFVSCSIL